MDGKRLDRINLINKGIDKMLLRQLSCIEKQKQQAIKALLRNQCCLKLEITKRKEDYFQIMLEGQALREKLQNIGELLKSNKKTQKRNMKQNVNDCTSRNIIPPGNKLTFGEGCLTYEQDDKESIAASDSCDSSFNMSNTQNVNKFANEQPQNDDPMPRKNINFIQGHDVANQKHVTLLPHYYLSPTIVATEKPAVGVHKFRRWMHTDNTVNLTFNHKTKKNCSGSFSQLMHDQKRATHRQINEQNLSLGLRPSTSVGIFRGETKQKNNSCRTIRSANIRGHTTRHFHSTEKVLNTQGFNKVKMAYGEQKTSNGLRRFSIRNNQPNKPTELTGTKKQLTHQECNYTMAMQKQRQEFVNESVTQKVWQFLGYKPVSMEGL